MMEFRTGGNPRSATALYLGSGTSTGVPLIGCNCAVCKSEDPRNRRLRSSVYIWLDGFGMLIDASPDFRQQALRFHLPRVDAVLITHAHVDHIFGMDDLRRFNTIQDARIPIYAPPGAVRTIDTIFDYIHKPPMPGTYLPRLDFVTQETPFDCGPFHVTPFPVIHGKAQTCGYKIDIIANGASDNRGAFSYASDCHELPGESIEIVKGSGVMTIDGLRYREHSSHLTIERAVEILAEIGAGKSFLTHMSHDVDHAALTRELATRYSTPATSIAPAYDGMTVDFGQGVPQKQGLAQK